MKIEALINEHYNQLLEMDFHILKYILHNKNICYQLGINELADKCNVSRSSILRLAQKLGFSGYSEFRVYLKWQTQGEVIQEMNSTGNLYDDIQETIKYTKTKDYEAICKLIDTSERIFVYGTGNLQLNCADELQRMFLSMQRHLYVIRAQKEFEIITQSLTANDLILIISFSGDTPIIFSAVQTLVAKGVPFVSITNLKSNRLATMTPYNLYAISSETKISDEVHIHTFSSFFIIGETLFRNYVDYRQTLSISKKKDEGPN
ncbi:MurR/RpiR family transcriptional regulator [Niallia nealsonii]|uniref:MurR/RpiR family transcriptional regulator n=1 Tax=Niallia nealsonii TaxID=115979 RepID=A0A2N0Z741_9BACI|nr:MurR/RpiR family transcriptional regulator [Niallia nealsonii]PKG25332.1 MurR/RpiR family transcriptional regulator [Niallia nealsonii]